MKIKRCKEVKGRSLQLIDGQSRYAFSLSDYEEFWDMKDWLKQGGYQGATIHFYDLTNRNVYTPFEKKKNVLYASPYIQDEYIYFLQGDFNSNKISLYKYLPEKSCEVIHELSIQDVNLYNLSIIGNELHIVSQDEAFISYYPEQFEISLNPNESVAFIDQDHIYLTAWIEEGVKNDTITSDYKYYEKMIVKDKKGNILLEELGNLQQMPDGYWWVV